MAFQDREDEYDLDGVDLYRSRAAPEPCFSEEQQGYVDGLKRRAERAEQAAARAAEEAGSAKLLPGAAASSQSTSQPAVPSIMPQGLAGAWMSKHGYYPSDKQFTKLQKLYYKVQPGLADASGVASKIGVAVRNVRSYLSRSLRAAMPDLLAHSPSPKGGMTKVCLPCIANFFEVAVCEFTLCVIYDCCV